ncbi:Arc family DNA-binding protein [Allokutzneria sp. A3M-2-11 16]|uniref:FitA-like ribbon-helix-helix domain-containing protein n=1 Tax=Allokutzneria sp. A3M-2-11 16 TaxID=2962043 RepID=UPI0020B7CB67|nr:Arc family DNA-binding protein [Allokutzneria sp. A3M-2-11 16]MCP3797931.1 Arc family DNA-binding protein [Allokutzneria sp. A3M-2-11 16]
MATLTIRDFDEELKARLRVRAAEHGRSMEAEVRAILASVLVKSEPGPGMGSRIRQRFDGVDDLSFEPPQRVEQARAAEFPE